MQTLIADIAQRVHRAGRNDQNTARTVCLGRLPFQRAFSLAGQANVDFFDRVFLQRHHGALSLKNGSTAESFIGRDNGVARDKTGDCVAHPKHGKPRTEGCTQRNVQRTCMPSQQMVECCEKKNCQEPTGKTRKHGVQRLLAQSWHTGSN